MIKKVRITHYEEITSYKLFFTCPHCGKEHSIKARDFKPSRFGTQCTQDKTKKIRVING